MRPFKGRRPSPALILAFVALIAALSGTAVALPGKNTVDSGDLKKGAVRNPDVRRNAITTSKVKGNTLRGSDILESSLAKVPAAASADTAANATQLGGRAASAYLRFNGEIPSGVTVIGNWYAAPSQDGVGSLGFDEVDLPALAPTALDSATANMGAGTTNGADNDATCTGTATAPTAPAGKMCFYVGFQTGLTSLSAFVSNGPSTTGAAVRVTGGAAATNKYARGGWAYTAP